jgi:hypothetical protein
MSEEDLQKELYQSSDKVEYIIKKYFGDFHKFYRYYFYKLKKQYHKLDKIKYISQN